MNVNKRPASWVTPTLGDVYTVVGGGTPSTEKKEYWGAGIPWVTSADIYGVRDIKPRKQVTPKGIENSTTHSVPSKTLLVVTRVGLGKIAITDTPTCFSQDVQGLIQSPDLIVPEFALYLLSYELQILKFQGRGTTISGITKKQLTDLEFPLAPLSEQQRIVAKVEELFSELDKGVENLRTAQQQLKVYRQALLKHAFEGKLTADWRAQNPDKLESAEALLVRIQRERAARYQQQLLDWQSAQKAWEVKSKTGSKPSKPKAPKTLSPLTTEELAELPELPEGWTWIRPEEIAAPEDYAIGIGPFGSNLKVSDYRESGVPLIFVRNITRSDFTRDLKYIDHAKYLELTAHYVKPLDLVITKMGDPPGDCEIYPAESSEAVLTADCLKFRLWESFANRQMYKSCINSNLVRKQLGLITKGVAQKKISVDRFKTICLPLMCMEEQKQISQELEEKSSILDQLETTITHSLQQAEALRQSILKKAFAGQLVTQDPADEPASALLARIQTERAAQPGKARTRKAQA